MHSRKTMCSFKKGNSGIGKHKYGIKKKGEKTMDVIEKHKEKERMSVRVSPLKKGSKEINKTCLKKQKFKEELENMFTELEEQNETNRLQSTIVSLFKLISDEVDSHTIGHSAQDLRWKDVRECLPPKKNKSKNTPTPLKSQHRIPSHLAFLPNPPFRDHSAKSPLQHKFENLENQVDKAFQKYEGHLTEQPQSPFEKTIHNQRNASSEPSTLPPTHSNFNIKLYNDKNRSMQEFLAKVTPRNTNIQILQSNSVLPEDEGMQLVNLYFNSLLATKPHAEKAPCEVRARSKSPQPFRSNKYIKKVGVSSDPPENRTPCIKKETHSTLTKYCSRSSSLESLQQNEPHLNTLNSTKLTNKSSSISNILLDTPFLNKLPKTLALKNPKFNSLNANDHNMEKSKQAFELQTKTRKNAATSQKHSDKLKNEKVERKDERELYQLDQKIKLLEKQKNEVDTFLEDSTKKKAQHIQYKDILEASRDLKRKIIGQLVNPNKLPSIGGRKGSVADSNIEDILKVVEVLVAPNGTIIIRPRKFRPQDRIRTDQASVERNNVSKEPEVQECISQNRMINIWKEKALTQAQLEASPPLTTKHIDLETLEKRKAKYKAPQRNHNLDTNITMQDFNNTTTLHKHHSGTYHNYHKQTPEWNSSQATTKYPTPKHTTIRNTSPFKYTPADANKGFRPPSKYHNKVYLKTTTHSFKALSSSEDPVLPIHASHLNISPNECPLHVQTHHYRPTLPIRKPVDLVSNDVSNFMSVVQPGGGSCRPSALINILHPNYMHLYNHPINSTMRLVNAFLNATFKNKDGVYDVPAVLTMSSMLGLNLTKQQINFTAFKNRDHANYIKESILLNIYNLLNTQNGIHADMRPNPFIFHKFFLGRGNNSVMVRTVLKQRWWWSSVSDKKDLESMNLIWTQWKKNHVFKYLPALKNDYESSKEQKKSNFDYVITFIGNTSSSDALYFDDSSTTITTAVSEEKYQDGEIDKKEDGSGLSIEHFSKKPLGINSNKRKKKKSNFSTTLKDELLRKCNSGGVSKHICNHLEDNLHLSNKKAMYINMKQFYQAQGKDEFSALPVTFHVKSKNDSEFHKFKEYYFKNQKNEKGWKESKRNKKRKGEKLKSLEPRRVHSLLSGVGSGGGSSNGGICSGGDTGGTGTPFPEEKGKKKEKAGEYSTCSTLKVMGNNTLENTAEAPFCLKEGNEKKNHNIWILKPGEYSNRGQGITVCKEFNEIEQIITENRHSHTFIIQKYIEAPLLINKRKFDIRVFALITSINACQKAYFYEDGYLRTSSTEFSLKNLNNRCIHLTNDAIQKKAEEYGKFEPGNKVNFHFLTHFLKISYSEFQKYLDFNYPSLNIDFTRDILSQIIKLVTDSIRAVYGKIDPNRRTHSFEVPDSYIIFTISYLDMIS